MSVWISAAIILLAMGMVAWPILQMMPTERQKEQIKLRQEAGKLGYQIRFKHVDLPSEIADQNARINRMPLYVIPKKLPALSSKQFLAVRSETTQSWFWPSADKPSAAMCETLNELYLNLPKQVLAVEHDGAGTGVFYTEFGGLETLEAIKPLIESLNQAWLKAA